VYWWCGRGGVDRKKALLLLAQRFRADNRQASIVGTVLDPQGLPVEGAKRVTLNYQGTNYFTTTVDVIFDPVLDPVAPLTRAYHSGFGTRTPNFPGIGLSGRIAASYAAFDFIPFPH